MTYVITEPCIDVKDLTCVEVCPVDAIFPEARVPSGQRKFTGINATSSCWN